MMVFICVGQTIHNLEYTDALPWSKFNSMESIHRDLEIHGKVFVFLSESQHKIKKKAEQDACEKALKLIN